MDVTDRNKLPVPGTEAPPSRLLRSTLFHIVFFGSVPSFGAFAAVPGLFVAAGGGGGSVGRALLPREVTAV